MADNIVVTSGAYSAVLLTKDVGAGVQAQSVTIVTTSGAVPPMSSTGGIGVTILAGAPAPSTSVNIVGTASTAVTVVSVPNPTYTNPALQVAVGGMSADASGPGSPFYGMAQFGIYSTGLPDLASGQVGALRLEANRSVHMAVTGSSGATALVTSSGGLGVTIIAGAGAGSTQVNITGSSGAAAVVTSSGGLAVTIVAGGGSGGTATADISTFTSGVTQFTPAGGAYVTTSVGALTSGQAAIVRMTDQRAFHVNMRSCAGINLTDETNNALKVTNITMDTVIGPVAHGSADAQAPDKVGQKAISLGANPVGVASLSVTDWYALRAGVPFVIGGHMNVQSLETAFTSSGTSTGGALSNCVLISNSTGKVVITQASALVSNVISTTKSIGIRIGFDSTGGTPVTAGVVLSHPGLASGSGYSRGSGAGILGVGGDAQTVKATLDEPTGGSVRTLISYFTLEG